MEYLFKILFSKGAATALSTLLFFSTPEFTATGTVFTVSGRLSGIFTNRVERIIRTGAEVCVTYDLTLIYSSRKGKTMVNRKLSHLISYDNLENRYHCSINGKRTVLSGKDAAFRLVEAYSTVFDLPDLLPEHSVNFYIEASINYASALEIDIPDNALWDYYIPNKKIRNCTIKEMP